LFFFFCLVVGDCDTALGAEGLGKECREIGSRGVKQYESIKVTAGRRIKKKESSQEIKLRRSKKEEGKKSQKKIFLFSNLTRGSERV